MLKGHLWPFLFGWFVAGEGCIMFKFMMFVFVVLIGFSPFCVASDITNCFECDSKGYITCPGCRGKGIARGIDVECPVCNGEKTLECKTCDEDGMVSCRKKCKKNNKDVYVVINPEWKKWKRTKSRSRAPEKYIPCPSCKGEGMVKCRDCKGTNKQDCYNCKGTGSVKGKGTCVRCSGKKIIPCPKCATLPSGTPEKYSDKIKQLESLFEQGLLRKDDYWHQRRSFVLKNIDLINRAIEKKNKVKEKVKGNDSSKRQKSSQVQKTDTLKALLKAWSSGVITLSFYETKRNSIGLSESEASRVEHLLARKHKNIRKYLSLKSKFRNGLISYDEYQNQLKSISQ
jgi:hypothetical protein